MATIIFNGKTYNGPEEMSAADRAAFEQLAGLFVDKNGNGIPDFLEGDIVRNVTTAYTNIVDINGKMFNDMNEMPEDMRLKVQEAFQKMSALGMVPNQTPSTLDQGGNFATGQGTGQVQSSPIFTPSPGISQQYPPTIQEGNRPGILQWILLGAIVALCVLVVAAGAIYFYVR